MRYWVKTALQTSSLLRVVVIRELLYFVFLRLSRKSIKGHPKNRLPFFGWWLFQSDSPPNWTYDLVNCRAARPIACDRKHKILNSAAIKCIDQLRYLWSVNCACALSTFHAATAFLGSPWMLGTKSIQISLRATLADTGHLRRSGAVAEADNGGFRCSFLPARMVQQ